MEIDFKKLFHDIESEIKEVNKRAKAKIVELQKPALAASVELFKEIGWDNWSEQELESEDQYARLQKSFTDKMELVSIDYITKSGEVLGTQVYKMSGNGCTCGDYISRKKPCKHMYFLAECLINGEQADVQLTLEDALPIKEMDFKAGKYEILGCCDKCRDCTSAGHCLQTDDYYKQCAYRKNLEKGKLFYGKCADDFDVEQYNALVGAFNRLSADEKPIVYRVIYTIACNYDTSCEIMCEFDNDLFSVLNNEQINSLGIKYSTEIPDYLRRIPLNNKSDNNNKKNMSQIAKDLGIRTKDYSRRQKGIEDFQNIEVLRKYILGNYILFTFSADLVRYYQELCHDYTEYTANRLKQIRENYDKGND